jgi:hypothetical protein
MPKIFLKALIILTLCSVVNELNAGKIPYVRAQNNVHITGFGDASIISANYERLVLSYRKFFMGVNLGLGYSQSYGLPHASTALLSMPMHVTGNLGAKSHYFEFGFGGTMLFYADEKKPKYWDFCMYPMIGYRFQPLKTNKFTLRVFSGYPITDEWDKENYWFFPLGLSIGFCFK